MRATDLLSEYRKRVNPPYAAGDLLILVATLFLLFAIPLIVISSQQDRNIGSKAKQEGETKKSTLISGKDYKKDELFIQWKPGVDKKSKEIIYKYYNLKKLKQAKGQEKYHVQLVKVDPTKAKQIISNLSQNKRVEKIDFILIPDTSPTITTDTKVKGLATPVHAQTLHDSMTTPEGTEIEIYSTQITAQEVYEIFKRNGLDAEVGKTLNLVKVQDDGYVYSSMGTIGSSQGQIPFAKIYLVASYLLQRPDFWIGHEYGHVFGWHYKWTVWNGSWSTYHNARGLLGDPRLESSYSWSTDEIFAEDYRQLLASYEAWVDAPYQGNWEIPLASEVPDLQEFLCTTFQSKTSNSWHRCQTEPDNEDPTAVVTSPSNGSTVFGLVDVLVTATDNVGIEKVELRIDGGLHATDLTSPYLFSWDTTKETNRSHTLAAKAYDAAGNVGTSSTITVTVDNQVAKPGDINGDGVVNIFDASILASMWGTSDPDADLNNDGIVDIFDASIIASNWDG